jgi:uncharacterized protein DUF4333
MSGPEGSDPTLPWTGQPAPGSGQPPSPPGYPPPQHPQYQPPPAPNWPPQQQYPAPGPGAPPPGYPTAPYPQPGQYGAPPQYQQPYQQPGSYAAAPPPAPSSTGSKKRLAVIGGIGALVVLVAAAVLIVGFWKPGYFRTTELNVTSAQTGVQRVLTDSTSGYGARDVKDVKCNGGKNPVVKQGATFSCDVTVNGMKRQVSVKFRDDQGAYEVSRPQ